MPDSRSFTIWDTIQNTIDDPVLTLYLVLDEAHRGMRAATGAGEKTTIVKRLINGSGPVPASRSSGPSRPRSSGSTPP